MQCNGIKSMQCNKIRMQCNAMKKCNAKNESLQCNKKNYKYIYILFLKSTVIECNANQIKSLFGTEGGSDAALILSIWKRASMHNDIVIIILLNLSFHFVAHSFNKIKFSRRHMHKIKIFYGIHTQTSIYGSELWIVLQWMCNSLSGTCMFLHSLFPPFTSHIP